MAPAVTERSTLVLWGNIKIPRVEYYESSAEQISDENGWFETDLDKLQDLDVHASLAGMPMAGIANSSAIDRCCLHTTGDRQRCRPLLDGP
jgi:hypothetical protein